MLDEPSWSIPYKRNVSFPEGLTPPAGGYLNPVTMKEQQRVNALMRENGIKEKTAKQQFYREFAGYRPATECMEVSDLNYPDGNNTTEALKMMKELAESDKPFFLTVGYAKPHLPFIAPKKSLGSLRPRKFLSRTNRVQDPGLPSWVYNPGGELRSGYTGIPLQGELPEAMQRELIHGYLACVSYVDAQIGRLLDGLKDCGLAGNTVVCLWGDHGWHLGDHGNWCKHSNFEEAARAPMIFASPWQRQKGGKSKSPVEFVDIFPTLCELCGLDIPEVLQGKSLVPQLDDPEASVRKAALRRYPARSAVR